MCRSNGTTGAVFRADTAKRLAPHARGNIRDEHQGPRFMKAVRAGAVPGHKLTAGYLRLLGLCCQAASLTKGCRMTRFPFSALAIVLALGSVGAPAQAQESPGTSESAGSHEGGAAIHAACAEDRKTYCGDAERGHGLQCLNSHLTSLSPNCASAVQAAMARHQNSPRQQ